MGRSPGAMEGGEVLTSMPSFMSKRRKHCVAIGYKDFAGRRRPSSSSWATIIRRTLTALKDKSGKPLTCQDDLAAKELGDVCSSVLPPEPEKKPEKD
jgi:hypothetical protein